MNLYLLRHGIAVAADEPGVESDGDRPLTAKGVKRMRRAAKGLRRLNVPFDALLTSPLIRARQTADIVAETLGLETHLEEVSGLTPESSVEQLSFGLTRFQNRAHLLLVGHEPLLSETASFFIAGKKGSKIDLALKKGGLCRIEIDAIPPSKPGTLHWMLTPKQLRLLGERTGKMAV
ncbi:MAG TPA: phosphohistidine phosphatase SixA [Candidatus Udaeobacter sp.]|jgi:phosphohistidine phosphatase|nr:phosphohistidine phosphatase SixA [Candidatus Udaeobacter sp.]